MNLRITIQSPAGIEKNPLMDYLYKHLKKLRDLGSNSPLRELNQIYVYMKKVKDSWKRTNPSKKLEAPLVIQLRKTACCGQDLVIQQGDYNITVKPQYHEQHNSSELSPNA